MSDKPLFDRESLHPGAAKALDRDGEALLTAGVVRPLPSPAPVAFESRREPVDTLTEADLVGEPLQAWADWAGQTLARYFVHDGHENALIDEGYKQLRRLVEKVLRTKPFSRGLSLTFVEEETFKWWRARIRDGGGSGLSSYLLDAAESAVDHHRILVPLSAIEIEHAFMFGDVLVTPIDAMMFDRMAAKAATKFPENAEQIRQAADRMRRDLGHLTAVGVEVVGEPTFARETAREVAFEIASVLRFMSPAAVSFNVTFSCFPHGADHTPMTTEILLKGDEISRVSTGILHSGFFNWKLLFAEIDHLMKQGFQNCAVFFEKAELTGFQQRVKKAITGYSQGVASYDVANRLIYAMSAAEHLLLRDASEPIQAGVGDRMAFITADTVEERKAVVANFKKAYALRSKQVHHLAGVDNEEVLTTFFRNMWVLLLQAIKSMPQFKEHSDFLDAIDRMKFA